MDILIKNIGGLPEDGNLTLTITPKGEIILGGCIFTHNFGKEVKAIALPEHHGRLGDLDALKNSVADMRMEKPLRNGAKQVIEIGELFGRIIDDAPVIVEASK